jgi:hypothetical protein
VLRIQRAVAAWMRLKRQLEEDYIEEYTNKIKKTSAHSKKHRGTRVLTTG